MNKWMSLFICLTLITLTGCNNKNNNAMEKGSGQSQIINVKNSTTNQIDRKNGQAIAKHLVALASNIRGVNDATAVVAGNYAVVGIDVGSRLDRQRVDTIKYTVAEALKKDPYGANAVVVADADTVVRLKEMGKSIQNGKPISGILKELADIVGRVVPELPNNVIENTKPNTPNQNKMQLNRKDSNKLDKIRKDQSNHR